MGLILSRVGGRAVVNLVLEKGERVTTGGKGKGRISGEAGEVTGVVANVPTMDSLGKWFGTFSGWQLEMWRYC